MRLMLAMLASQLHCDHCYSGEVIYGDEVREWQIERAPPVENTTWKSSLNLFISFRKLSPSKVELIALERVNMGSYYIPGSHLCVFAFHMFLAQMYATVETVCVVLCIAVCEVCPVFTISRIQTGKRKIQAGKRCAFQCFRDRSSAIDFNLF